MIIEELVLHNYSVYAGRQVIPLSPPSPQKPVILFGGLNGTGKTSLLSAIEVALYGRFSTPARETPREYEDFLLGNIHKSRSPREGAAIEVEFRHNSDGVQHKYRVHRSWSKNGSALKERVEVLRDGAADHVLTDYWNEHVNDFMPQRLSQLFFFDGERIESLADESQSAELLASAVQSLLGVDLIDRLRADLLTVAKRKQANVPGDTNQQEIQSFEKKVEQLDAQFRKLTAERGVAQNIFDRARRSLQDIEARFRTEGGDLFERREELLAKRESVQVKLSALRKELIGLVADILPLLLVEDLLAALRKQDHHEQRAIQARLLKRVLKDRDDAFLMWVGRVPKEMRREIKDYLDDDRAKRSKLATSETYLHLAPETRELFNNLLTRDIPDVKEDVTARLAEVEGLDHELVNIDRQIAGIPDRDAIAGLIDSLKKAREGAEVSQKHVESLSNEIARVLNERQQAKQRLMALVNRDLDSRFERADSGRVQLYANRARETLGRFREVVIHRQLGRIEQNILECFQLLLRKEALVSALRIDPKSFHVHFSDSSGTTVPAHSLSAGERQLLAISMLWGLARTSGCTLPTIIDTPLGRLDTVHRSKVVERYFPFASHQVILLSTDEEITGPYYESLKPFIGRTYRLNFDDASSSTQVSEGYF